MDELVFLGIKLIVAAIRNLLIVQIALIKVNKEAIAWGAVF